MPKTRNPRGRGPALLMAVAVVPLLLGACGGGGGVDDGGGPEVVMELVAFKPETIEVKAGRTVSWRQKDAGSHTVTSGTVEQGAASVTQRPDGRFDSGSVETEGTFRFTFDQPGTYPYFCSLHPATMRGEVRVS